MRSPAWIALGIAVTACHQSPVATGPASWRLVEELRIGGTDEGPASFSDVRGILVDRQDRIWVLEFSTQNLRVFDSTGTPVRVVGRRGEGPGEFIYADGVTQTSDGVIWGDDPQAHRLTAFSEEGVFLRQVPKPTMGYSYIWRGGADSTGRLWADFISADTGSVPGPDNHPMPRTRMRFRRSGGDGATADTVDAPTCTWPGDQTSGMIRGPGGMMMIPFHPTSASALDFNGRAACVPSTDRHVGFITGLAGTDTLARFTLPGGPVPVAKAERDSAVSGFVAFAKRIKAVGVEPSMVPAVRPAIESIWFDDAGRLWVQRVTAGGGAEFDVVAPDGRHLATIATAIRPISYFRPVARGDRFYFIGAGEDDVPQVIRARLVTTPK